MSRPWSMGCRAIRHLGIEVWAIVAPLKAVADEAVALAPSVRRVIVVQRLTGSPLELDPERDVAWDQDGHEPGDDFEGATAADALADPDVLTDPDGLVPPTDPESPYMVIY